VDAVVLAYEAAPKAAYYSALAIAIGVIVARWLLDRADAPRAIAANRLAALSVAAAVALLVASLLRLVGHTIAAFGPTEAWTAENFRLIAMESRWGESWRLQLMAAVALTIAAIAVWSRAGRGWRWTALAAIACSAATPLLGHAAGSFWRVGLHGAHLLGGGAWLGTLIAIVLLDGLAGRRHEPHGLDDGATDQREAVTAGLVEQFSPVALTAATLVAASGLLAAFSYLAAPSDLLQTAYGRALTIKLTLVLAILVCGYANWQRSRAQEAPWVPLLRTESALAMLVLIVTSVLTELEHP
jgi:putative copper export protein